MADPVNGAVAAEEELVDYEEEEVAAEGDAKADQVRFVDLWEAREASTAGLQYFACFSHVPFIHDCPIQFVRSPSSAQVKKGYVGIHSSGFKDFLLKPELLRAIQDCGFEHPSEGTRKLRLQTTESSSPSVPL